MTTQQAMESGLIRIRLPVWNQRSYLKLEAVGNGMYGPWATLFDPVCEEALGLKPQKILSFGRDETDWEEYTGSLAKGDE